jgi:hypothetical protein
MKWVLVVFSLSALSGGTQWSSTHSQFDDVGSCEAATAAAVASERGIPHTDYPTVSIGRMIWAECIADDVWSAYNKELWHKFNKPR